MFRNEDSGPPELTEEQLQELDREAMATEINRLTEMKAVARKPLQELQRVEERERQTERQAPKELNGSRRVRFRLEIQEQQMDSKS